MGQSTRIIGAGGAILTRSMKSKGMSVSFAADPEPPDRVTALYAAR